MNIDLNNLDSTKINLSGITGVVKISGTHRGGALEIRNACNVILLSSWAKIESTDKENAIVLVDPIRVTIQAGEYFSLNQSITVWGKAQYLRIKGVHIVGAHTGIRVNTDRAHTNIRIEDCLIRGCAHEGIYIGPHWESDNKLTGVIIDNCIIENNGWDGGQIGNSINFEIKRSVIRNNALLKEPGQDYEVTINPGSIGHIWANNTIDGPIQSLASRTFLYKR